MVSCQQKHCTSCTNSQIAPMWLSSLFENDNVFLTSLPTHCLNVIQSTDHGAASPATPVCTLPKNPCKRLHTVDTPLVATPTVPLLRLGCHRQHGLRQSMHVSWSIACHNQTGQFLLPRNDHISSISTVRRPGFFWRSGLAWEFDSISD